MITCTWSDAYVTSNTLFPQLCENEIYDCYTSLSMWKYQIQSKIKKNKFQDYKIGFELDNNGDAGPQGTQSPDEVYDNEWNTSVGNAFDSWSSNVSNTNFLRTKFFTRSTSPYFINTFGNIGGSIDILSIPVSANYIDDCPSSPSPFLTQQIKDEIIRLNSDTMLGDEDKWSILSNIYVIAKQDTNINQSDSVISSFLELMDNDPIGIFYSINKILHSAYTDSTQFDPDSMLIDSAITLNLSVDTSFHINKRIRYVNDIFLHSIAFGNYSISSVDSTALQSMAILCPNYGGPAVQTARVILYILGDTNNYFLGDTACTTSDTCSSPALPNPIDGDTLALCGQIGASYDGGTVSGATSYKWVLSDTSLANFSGPDNLTAATVNFTDSIQSLVLTFTAINSCGSTSRSIILKGGPGSLDSIEGSSSVCSGGYETYSVDGSYGALYYEWSVPSGTTILSGQGSNDILVLLGSNSGDISVKAMNDCDTTDVQKFPIIVNSCRQSQEAFQFNGLRAYPNPTLGQISLKFASQNQLAFDIFVSDMTGKALLNLSGISELGLNSVDLDLNEFEKGIYFIKFTNFERTEIVRVVKQ